MTNWRNLVLCTTLSLSVAGHAMAEEKAAPAKPMDPKAQAMAAEQEKAMAEMMKLATPGEHHGHLKQFEGSWKAKTTMWMDPAAPPETSEGTMVNKWVLGGRFLHQEFKGTFAGQPFEGMGLWGYDNAKGKYVATWSDTMGTMIMMIEGKCDGGGKSWEMSGQMWDPMTKKDMKFRETLKVDSPTKHTFTMYMPGPDGKEMKSFEIVYEK